jgi:hypothetical protein
MLKYIQFYTKKKKKKKEEEIYMRQPEGYHTGGPIMVFRLCKSLYGLKQAVRQWNKKLWSVLKGIGYSRLRSDNSIYIYSKGDIKVIVPVFIDDITLVSKHRSLISYHYLPLLEVSVDSVIVEQYHVGQWRLV